MVRIPAEQLRNNLFFEKIARNQWPVQEFREINRFMSSADAKKQRLPECPTQCFGHFRLSFPLSQTVTATDNPVDVNRLLNNVSMQTSRNVVDESHQQCSPSLASRLGVYGGFKLKAVGIVWLACLLPAVMAAGQSWEESRGASGQKRVQRRVGWSKDFRVARGSRASLRHKRMRRAKPKFGATVRSLGAIGKYRRLGAMPTLPSSTKESVQTGAEWFWEEDDTAVAKIDGFFSVVPVVEGELVDMSIDVAAIDGFFSVMPDSVAKLQDNSNSRDIANLLGEFDANEQNWLEPAGASMSLATMFSLAPQLPPLPDLLPEADRPGEIMLEDVFEAAIGEALDWDDHFSLAAKTDR